MKVDVQSLDTFNRVAREGAEAATAALSQLTGIDLTVEVTRISLIDRADVGDELGDHGRSLRLEPDGDLVVKSASGPGRRL